MFATYSGGVDGMRFVLSMLGGVSVFNLDNPGPLLAAPGQPVGQVTVVPTKTPPLAKPCVTWSAGWD